jgi:hypothetical protein
MSVNGKRVFESKRLYSAMFPAYFGLKKLRRKGQKQPDEEKRLVNIIRFPAGAFCFRLSLIYIGVKM